MNEPPILQRLIDEAADDWDHAAGWFHRDPAAGWLHRDTASITSNTATTDPQEGNTMPLAETTAGLQDVNASLTASLETAGAAIAEASDNHVARLAALTAEVAAIAAIAGKPVMQAAESILDAPEPVQDGVVKLLQGIAATYPRNDAQAASEPAAQPA